MNKVESADLILKLYDLRREEKMREARSWMLAFMPDSAAEVMQAMIDPKSGTCFRQAITYWDMAASLVNHGAIDEQMFNDAAGEHIVYFAKIEPFLTEVREIMNSPRYLYHLETLVMRMPNAKEILEQRREMIKRMMQARAAATT